MNILSKTDSLTIDSVQQTALAFKVITEQTDELSPLTQVKYLIVIMLCTKY